MPDRGFSWWDWKLAGVALVVLIVVSGDVVNTAALYEVWIGVCVCVCVLSKMTRKAARSACNNQLSAVAVLMFFYFCT